MSDTIQQIMPIFQKIKILSDVSLSVLDKIKTTIKDSTKAVKDNNISVMFIVYSLFSNKRSRKRKSNEKRNDSS